MELGCTMLPAHGPVHQPDPHTAGIFMEAHHVGVNEDSLHSSPVPSPGGLVFRVTGLHPRATQSPPTVASSNKSHPGNCKGLRSSGSGLGGQRAACICSRSPDTKLWLADRRASISNTSIWNKHVTSCTTKLRSPCGKRWVR